MRPELSLTLIAALTLSACSPAADIPVAPAIPPTPTMEPYLPLEGTCVNAWDIDSVRFARQLGVETVRIDAPWSEIGLPDSRFEQAARAAKELSLKSILILNPGGPKQDADYIAKVDYLYTFFRGSTFMGGVEPDNTKSPGDNPDTADDGQLFWDGTKAEFTHFFATAYHRIRELDRLHGQQTTIIFPALVDPYQTGDYVVQIAAMGVRLDDERLLFGAHAYNNPMDLEANITALWEVLVVGFKIPIWRIFVDELGGNTPEAQAGLGKIIKNAYARGAAGVCLYEVKPYPYTPWTVRRDLLPDILTAFPKK